jgi:ElaB/YqjD/DUF883 family membrane-anchored ribosome-binding protein
MKTGITKRLTPEQEELHKKRVELADIENALAQHELDLATLQAQINIFLTRYLTLVGLRYRELDEINAQIAEAEARLKPRKKDAKDKANEARSRAEESAKATKDTQHPEQLKEFIPSDKLKKLYWEVAKKIHPDLCTDEKEQIHRQHLMIEANRAYEQGDEERLQSILEEWEARPEIIEKEDVATQIGRLTRKISNARERIRHIIIRMDELRKSDLNTLYDKVKEADAEGEDLLKKMTEQVNIDIMNAKERLRKLGLENIRK